MTTHRYYRWDGSQHVFDLDAEDVFNSMADDILEHGDANRALRNLMQRGMRDSYGQQTPNLRDILERLRQQRQEQLERYNLDSAMDDIKERLQDVIDTERSGMDKRLSEAQQQLEDAGDGAEYLQDAMEMLQQRAQRNSDALDGLPESMGGKIQQLQEYDFMDQEARQKFDELLDTLKQQMMQNFFQNMKQQIEQMTPQDMQAIKNMIQALNQMLYDRAMGDDPDFEGFMEQYGEFFDPDRPASLDELIERIQQQMAAMQSLMNSMSPEMRSQLEDMLGAAMDAEMMQELAELADTMYEMLPYGQMEGEYPFMGEESLTLDSAMELMGDLQQMDQLEQQIEQIMRSGDIQDIDLDKVEEVMGEDARRQLEQLQKMIQQLEDAGYLKRKGNRLELTPRGIRKLAQQALREVFSELKKDRQGRHEIYQRGDGGERTGETKPYEFGDAFNIDMHRTLFNSTLRNGPGTPLRISPQDFEIHHTEHLTQTATALLIDQSSSMGGSYGVRFTAAKKIALALYWLIHSQYPRDYLYIIGFSDYAMDIPMDDLADLTWNHWTGGTNMQHALMLARKALSAQKVATKQILMITDGEPTAHLEHGRAFFDWPTSWRTRDETLKEVKRCTQEGITINTFMLEPDYYLMDFIDKMTRINKGRAFYTDPSQLGRYVMVDYLRSQRKRIA